MSNNFAIRKSQARFWRKVNKAGDHWLWLGQLDKDGYGQYMVNYRQLRAHRIAYEWLVGPIPTGMTIDHLCAIRNCVDPTHMEVVTITENVLRGDPGGHNRIKTYCPQGHMYTPANTIYQGNKRSCRECKNAWLRTYRAAKRVAGSTNNEGQK